MKKPQTYTYSDFVKKVELESAENKRYWLKLTIDNNKTEGITVILKNPSKATDKISDKTVFNVSNYIYRNRDRFMELTNIGTLTIVNLIPHYLTDSSKLQELRDQIIDEENIKTISKICAENKKTIIAWGNHPSGLFKEYRELKESVMQILSDNKNEVFYVDKFSLDGNPKHGQVWGYANELKKMKQMPAYNKA